jgi:signal transduction histidine kinase
MKTSPKLGTARNRLITEGARSASDDERATLLRFLVCEVSHKLRNAIAGVPLSTEFLRLRLKRTIRHNPKIGEALADIDESALRVARCAETLIAGAAPD